MTEPIFRKRGTGKKTVRKKNNAEASVGDAQTDRDSDLSVALRETRQIQRERARGKGCEASATSDEVLSLIAARGGGYSVVTDEESKEGGLQSTFIVQQDDGKDVNPLLEQYIQQGLKEFRERKAKTVLARQKESGIHIEEAPKPEGDFDTLKEAEKQLYAVPEHLKAREAAHSDDTISESWLTGIQEVELPMEYKLQNIEATENAKKQLLEQVRGGDTETASTFNTRFQKPSAETQLIRPAQKGTVAGQKRANPSEDATPRNNKEEQKNQASDDAAFDRFKKRFRYP